jgi:hypothetical protein
MNAVFLDGYERCSVRVFFEFFSGVVC